MMHLNNSIRYKRSFVNINPQSNTDFTQVTCTVNFYYTWRDHKPCSKKRIYTDYSQFKVSSVLPVMLTKHLLQTSSDIILASKVDNKKSLVKIILHMLCGKTSLSLNIDRTNKIIIVPIKTKCS
jgi:hypothetical protein